MLGKVSLRTFCRSQLQRIDMRPTAGLIVIGDEILKGSTMDTNSNFIAKKLHQLGVSLKKTDAFSTHAVSRGRRCADTAWVEEAAKLIAREPDYVLEKSLISAIGDNVDEIANEIREFSARYDYVFTTGGVGPTHDDKTYIGLARAFNDELRKSSEIVDVITQYLRKECNRRQFLPNEKSGFVEKLSMIPSSAELLWSERAPNGKPATFPVVRLRNVISLPGVPRFCEKAFSELQEQLFSPQLKPVFSKTIYTSQDEFMFAKQLSEVALSYEGVVDIGSYPVMKNTFFKTKLIVESEFPTSGQAVAESICKLLKDSVVHYDEEPWVNALDKLNQFRERQAVKNVEFVSRLDDTLTVLRKTLQDYPLEQISLSFNGGKDCTVLLHMFRLVVDEKYGTDVKLQGFHILCEDQFPEATQFIIDVAKKYNIVVTEYPGPLKSGLELLKKEQPDVVAVLMGSRASDPHGKYMKSPYQWTDDDWPRVLRVFPIFAWTYSDVWTTLRGLCIPYCPLYDMGYTSLGGRSSTVKNPLLKVVGSDDDEKYMPAYTLTNGDAERNGRSLV